MKTKIYAFVLIFILASWNSCPAQELMEAITEAAKEYNKQEYGNEEGESNDMSPEEKKKVEGWKKAWEQHYKDVLAGCLDAFDTRLMNCYVLMTSYWYAFNELDKATKAEENCRMRYDLHGMQAIALGMAPTIYYCPEQYADNIKEVSHDLYVQLSHLRENSDDACVEEFIDMEKIIFTELRGYDIPDGDDINDFMLDLIDFFHPISITRELLDINGRMTALDDMGCAGN